MLVFCNYVEGIIDILRMVIIYLVVVCYRDDDVFLFEYLVEKNWSDMSVCISLEIWYSLWVVEMMNGYGKKNEKEIKEIIGKYLI